MYAALSQDYTANRWQIWGLNSDNLEPEFVLINIDLFEINDLKTTKITK